jgi:hypothetical protein
MFPEEDPGHHPYLKLVSLHKTTNFPVVLEELYGIEVVSWRY